MLLIFSGAVHPIFGNGDDVLHAFVDGIKLFIGGDVFFGNDDAPAEQLDEL